MSEYTTQVDRFIIDSLQPEIDTLNLSLTSMEEYGFENVSITDTRRKVSALMPVYQFLKEYVHGKEECDLVTLRQLISATGLASVHHDNNEIKIQTTRSEAGLNKRLNSAGVRLYLDGEILTDEFIPGRLEAGVLTIYANKAINNMVVNILRTTANNELLKSQYAGANNVSIPDFELNDPATVLVEVKTYRNNELIETINMAFRIIFNDCELNASLYIAGTTPERFTIADDKHESSTLLIDPNKGSNTSGTRIDWDWFENNFDQSNVFTYLPGSVHEITVNPGATHILVALPPALTISKITEDIMGDEAELQEGFHYGIMFERISGPNRRYRLYYIRDIGTTVFEEQRTFKLYMDELL